MTSSSFHHQQDAAAIDNPTMAEESLVAVGPAAALVPTAAMIINPNFPVKLHCCLTELESYGLAHIASFQPHGRCFVVHKKDEFVKDILPRYVVSNGNARGALVTRKIYRRIAECHLDS